jgi:hypothetical protein
VSFRSSSRSQRALIGLLALIVVLGGFFLVAREAPETDAHVDSRRKERAREAPGATLAPGTAAPAADWIVRGRTLDWSSQTPLAGSIVQAFESTNRDELFRLAGGCESGGDGAFEIRVPGRLTSITLMATRGLDWRSDDLRVVRSSANARVDLSLFRGREVKGVVVLPSGEPASGAIVDAWCSAKIGPDENPQRLRLICDAEGRFTAQGFVGTATFIARKQPHAQSEILLVTCNPGIGQQEVRLALRTAQPVSGRVLSANGSPVSRAYVQAYLRCGASVSVETDEDGSFQFRSFPLAALFGISARHRQHGVARVDGVLGTDYYTIRFSALSPCLHGRLVDCAGMPLANEVVKLRSPVSDKAVLTDPNGEFAFRNLDLVEGDYRLSSATGLFGEIVVHMSTRNRHVPLGDIVVHDHGTLLVAPRASRKPSTNVRVCWQLLDAGNETVQSVEHRAGRPSRFRIPLCSLPVRVVAEWRGVRLSSPFEVRELRPGERRSVTVPLTLDRLRVLRGRVRDRETEAPVPYFGVFCLVVRGPERLGEGTDIRSPDGSFEIATAPGEILEFKIHAKGYQPLTVDPADLDGELDLRLSPEPK